MKRRRRPELAGVLALAMLVIPSDGAWPRGGAPSSGAGPSDGRPAGAPPPPGLWHAHRVFGPEVAGSLTLLPGADGRLGVATLAGYVVAVSDDDGRLTFEIPGSGRFDGAVSAGGHHVRGHWIQPRQVASGQRWATPVELQASNDGGFRGVVTPLPDRLTLYLPAERRGDGTLGAFLRNPERNLGIFARVDRIERDAAGVRLVGTFFRSPDEQVLAEGSWDPDHERIHLDLPDLGGAWSFERLAPGAASHFWPRGLEKPPPWSYRAPRAADEGWPVATLAEVGMDVEPLRRLVEIASEPERSVHDLAIHAILVARHGRLVFEEYFRGFDRETPHDTRSAGKSVTATLVGAAMRAGLGIRPETRVFPETPPPGEAAGPEDLDPRKLRMTVEHLLTMASGFDCDDSNDDTPGNEDRMQSQAGQPDWYRYIRDLPMAFEPGERSVYCSANPHLLGQVLSRAAGEPLTELIARLLAEPLGIRRYHLPLSPTGAPYMGGGIRWLPRDFLKLGQLYLDGGVWNGRRILSAEFVRSAVEPRVRIGERDYGYLWWVESYEWRGRILDAFLAGGNGGQIVVVVPELDLAVAFFAGNYSDRVFYRIQNELLPELVLPAVLPEEAPGAREPGATGR